VALTGLAALPATALLSGCVTTQQVAARERLVDARIRASQVALALGAPDPEVHVAGLSLLRARGGTAIVAELHNASGHPLTDLPVLVGLRTRTKHTLYLNRAANADYFDNHVVSIPAYGTVTWVFTSGGWPRRGRQWRKSARRRYPSLPWPDFHSSRSSPRRHRPAKSSACR
jgi:hypothetical protein